MASAEEWVQKYAAELGAAPKDATQLRNFALARGGQLSFVAARGAFEGGQSIVDCSAYVKGRTTDTTLHREATASLDNPRGDSKSIGPRSSMDTVSSSPKKPDFPPVPEGEKVLAKPRSTVGYAASPVAPAGAPQCDNGHGLEPFNRTEAGSNACDGCLRRCYMGEAISTCKECEFYLCATCCQRAQGMAIAPSAPPKAPEAGAGLKCENGHGLAKYVRTEAGSDNCHECLRRCYAGEEMATCKECDFFMCGMCSSRAAVPLGKVFGADAAAKTCEEGHPLHKFIRTEAGSDNCCGCLRRCYKDEELYNCKECDYYLCSVCYQRA